MSTTLQDIAYEDYLESLHNDYVAALESFASSKDVDELKHNLEKLNKTVHETEDIGNSKLEKTLNEIASLNLIYKEIISSERRGKKRFIIGTVLACVGLLLTGIGLYLTIKAL